MKGAGFKILVPLLMAVGTVYAEPKHVIFAYVDHFEPYGTVEQANQMTSYWVDDYIAMASKHTDADGRHPIHSYFLICWPYIQLEQLNGVLNTLNKATYTGYGEVELHCHHGWPNEGLRTEQEATDELLYILSLAKQEFNKHGALITAEADPNVTFSFIHGMWALDNSRYNNWSGIPAHYEYCGVNREMDLLKREGSFADFTFPAPWPMDSTAHNLIYYAEDDNSPGSYHYLQNVFPVEVNCPPMDKLMIIQGPYSRTNIGVKPEVYYDAPELRRMDLWVGEQVHIIGNNDWIFVKVYTHGLDCDVTYPETWDSYFGPTMDKFYYDIENKYNDGINWKLHYVSAREMYNIVKAAEAGKTGDPNDYRDFLIPQYANMRIFTENNYNLITYNAEDIWFEILDNPETVDMSFKNFDTNVVVLESFNKGGPLYLSDATIETGESGELRLQDTTTSRFYYIVKLF